MKEGKIVISLGGSLIIPDKLDIAYLKNLKNILINYKSKYQFFIVCGGGKIAREYIQAAQSLEIKNKKILDEIGIKACLINAKLLLSIFEKNAQSLPSFQQPINSKENKIIINESYEVGASSDNIAVEIAIRNKIETVLNLSNIDYLYTEDPRISKKAEKIKSIKWKEFHKLFSSEWKAGLNIPFDPIASTKAEKNNIKVIITNGKNLENFENILNEKSFEGTKIY